MTRAGYSLPLLLLFAMSCAAAGGPQDDLFNNCDGESETCDPPTC